MNFKFDTVQPHNIVDREDGIEITRGCLVTDIDISPGVSDPAVFLKILKSPLCPLRNSTYPDPDFNWCLCKERRLLSVSANNAANCQFVYRGVPPVFGGGISYELEDANVTETVNTFATASGDTIKIQYKKGGDTVVVFTNPFVEKPIGVRRIRSYRCLRATGMATKSEWFAVRDTIKALRNNINSVPWGGEPRGTWMFLGPISRIQTNNNRVQIELPFIEGIDGHYPIGAYFDQYGFHPADCTTEADLRADGLPVVGAYHRRNGITIASVYPEINFNSFFNFTP
jgi:hypothetical protein